VHVYAGSILLYFVFFCVVLIDFTVYLIYCLFLLSVPVQVIASGTVSEMIYNVLSGMLNLTHLVFSSLCLSLLQRDASLKLEVDH